MPTQGQIICNKINARFPTGAHPRLFRTEKDFAYLSSRIGSGDLYDEEIRAAIKKADGYLALPPETYRISDGIRLLGVSRSILARVSTLALVYRVTGEKKYAKRATEEMLAACAFPDFHPSHFLDTAELSFGVALGYDWLYSYLTEEEREKIRTALVNFGLYAVLDDYRNLPRTRTYRWYQDVPGNNWKFVCNGGCGITAMVLCGEIDPALCEEVLTAGYESNKKLLETAYEPLLGAYVEGVTYWEYATRYLCFYVSALETAAGDTFGLLNGEGIRKTGTFPLYLSSNVLVNFNYSDCGRDCPSAVPDLYLGHILGIPEISAIRIDKIRAGERQTEDLFWLNLDEYAPVGNLAPDFVAEGAETATFRQGFGKDDAFAGIHFGANNAYHGHVDMGTFVYEVKGKRFFVDLGPDDYNIPYYRHSYRIRAEGHNVPVINPSDAAGQERNAAAVIEDCGKGEGGAYAIATLDPAYPEKKVRRGFRLFRPSGAALVCDEIACDEKDRVFWFGHTPAEIALSDDGKEAVLTLDGVTVRVRSLGDGVFTAMEAKGFPESPESPGQAENKGVRKLAIRLEGKEFYRIAVAILPEGCETIPEVKALSEWKTERI